MVALAMNDSTSDNAGVIAIPPIVYFVGLLPGLLLHYLYPVKFLPAAISVWSGVLLILMSVLMVLSALLAFRRVGTSPDVRKPTTAISTDGIYQFSRNPMYISLTLVYLGIAAWVNSLWILLLLVPVLVVLTQGVIKREERYLKKKFGDEYLRYKSQVRRWI